MATAQAMPMPTFVARCLEEIGLEGRCGLPVRDMFTLVEDANDVVYRKFAWKVIRAMDGQVTFHYMLRRTTDDQEEKTTTTTHAKETAERREKRRRKWSTTLLPVDEGNADHATKTHQRESKSDLSSGHQRKRRRRRIDANGKESATDVIEETSANEDMQEDPNDVQSERRDARQNQQQHDLSDQSPQSRSLRSRSSQSRSLQSRSSQTRSPQRSSGSKSVSPQARSRENGCDCETFQPRSVRSSDVVNKTETNNWITRSPRGYDLGEELDVTGLSYEDAIRETPEGVLGIVACEELRLKYLGIVDPSGIDTTSPQFDLLELIGRAREQGLNAALVAETGIFGDSRKLHYLLDLLIASNIVVKNMVSADQKRFNILHLTRFVSHFHPSMISPTAAFERDSFPKDQLPHMIARILRSRGERTCVFADIGRELGFGKRHQEKLRKYFFHQMHMDANFPLELFMARCNTGTDTKGRKLWCVRLRSTGRSSKASGGDDNGPSVGSGPVIERGIMEQLFANIQERQDEGATIPELRDVLGVPTFKLPYKLAQGLISNYSMGVEQVVLGKNTMYRMFAPGVVKAEQEIPMLETAIDQAITDANDTAGRDEVEGRLATKEGEIVYQPSTLKEATRGLVVASTADRRRQFILDRVNADKIISIHQLRTGLIEAERPKGKPVSDVGLIDIRSVRRIVDDLVSTNAIVTVDITLPPKRVLQKEPKIVKCIALPGAQRDRAALRNFIDGYFEEQQQKFLESLDHENDKFIVVSNRLSKKMSKRRDSAAFERENENKEIVKYSAASYKLARVQLVMLHKQGRRLGMYFGIMHRCKALHLLMWDRVPLLRTSRRLGKDECDASPASPTTHNGGSSVAKKELVFALKEILDLLTVREYIQLVGVSEVLTDAEENKVRMAIARGDSWNALGGEISEKIRGCEADRFSKVLRVLIELGLVQVVNDSSLDLLNAMRRSTEDFDQVISQVAYATLSGGLLLLKDKARIMLKRGNKILKQLPHKTYVYAAGFSGSNRSEHYDGRVPLEFTLTDVDAVKEFWKALKFLSLEGARLGSNVQDIADGNVNLDPELVRPVPLRDHNVYAVKVWVPRATTNYSAPTERGKAAADAVEQEQNGSLKRKRYHSVMTSRVSGRAEKVQRRDLAQAATSAYHDLDGDDTGSDRGRGWRQMDGWGGAKSQVRAAKWSSEDDAVLMDHFVEKLSHQWFIDVPLALQKRDERVAFRSTTLTRTKISWKVLATKLGRKKEDCTLRVRELLTVPAIQARVEKTKQAITRAKNPGGVFHEELAVLKQPKLTALLCRALQIIFHEQASYHSMLADMLLSNHWKEAEVKLVWRYLWLGSVISRTKMSQGKGQKQRGFCLHSHVSEMTSLHIPNYTMDFFCDAAEYASFIQQNVEEAELAGDETNQGFVLEQDIEANAPSGHVAIDLTAIVMNAASYTPELSLFSAGAQKSDADQQFKKSITPTLQQSKRSLAIKGFAGHLCKRFDGVLPDDFLREFWGVRAQYGTSVNDNAKPFRGDESVGSVQAFSSCAQKKKRVPSRRSDNGMIQLTKWLQKTLDVVGRNGATVAELKTRCKVENVGRGFVDTNAFDIVVDSMISKGRCFEVNGSDAVRLVSASHSSMWTLHPYRIGDDSTKDKVHFVFDNDRTIVSKPWLHLDGSVNSTVSLMFKRRVVNIVMCSPGIPDHIIHKKMHRGLTLQDTRSLLDELLEEELLYARASHTTHRSRKPRNIFDVGKRESSSIPLYSWSAGCLRGVDNDRDQLFYFPSVNCVELLGALASDSDLGRHD